ncbi:hypothetical protein AeNC1_000175 [Aphanomyces euteiches]|nr:hypothetical protein AeNC1_000175 [Aphanomyces euteiches]
MDVPTDSSALVLLSDLSNQYDLAEAHNGSPYCYICLDSVNRTSGDDLELIAPCACQTYIHRCCLDGWRRTSQTINCQTHCPTCLKAFQMESSAPLTKNEHGYEVISTYWWRFMSAYILVVSAVVFLFNFTHWYHADSATELDLLPGCFSIAALSLFYPIIVITLAVLGFCILYNMTLGILNICGVATGATTTAPIKIPDPPRVQNLRPLLTN